MIYPTALQLDKLNKTDAEYLLWEMTQELFLGLDQNGMEALWEEIDSDGTTSDTVKSLVNYAQKFETAVNQEALSRIAEQVFGAEYIPPEYDLCGLCGNEVAPQDMILQDGGAMVYHRDCFVGVYGD